MVEHRVVYERSCVWLPVAGRRPYAFLPRRDRHIELQNSQEAISLIFLAHGFTMCCPREFLRSTKCVNRLIVSRNVCVASGGSRNFSIPFSFGSDSCPIPRIELDRCRCNKLLQSLTVDKPLACSKPCTPANWSVRNIVHVDVVSIRFSVVPPHRIDRFL